MQQNTNMGSKEYHSVTALNDQRSQVNMAGKVCVSVHRDRGKEVTQRSFQQGRTEDKHTGKLVLQQEGKRQFTLLYKMQKLWLRGWITVQ